MIGRWHLVPEGDGRWVLHWIEARDEEDDVPTDFETVKDTEDGDDDTEPEADPGDEG